MKKYLIVLFLLGNLHMCFVINAAPAGKPGINLTDQGAFVNIINHTNRYAKAIGYDSLGWPLSDFELVLMDNRPVAEWSGTIDDPEIYRIDCSGTYKAGFTGRADINISGSGATIVNKTYDTGTNTTRFDMVVPAPPSNGHGFIYLTFTNTRRTAADTLNSGITGFKVMRPGYELSTNKIFTDEYITLCQSAEFACYRYYTLQNIWDGEPAFPQTTTWESRKIPSDACQQPMASLNGKRDAWCWEHIIELANIIKKDIWICIHISCDSSYVISLAKMLKEELNPEINIFIENSNEVWSPTQATHGPYNKAQADFYKISFDENYARRTVELSRLFSQVFGKDEINKRIRVILAGQHSYPGRNDLHLNYINKTYGPPNNYIYAISTALYFTSANPNGTVGEINDGMINDINSQIFDNKKSTYRKTHIDKALKWALPGGCTSYEGGPHLPAGGGSQNLANQINAHRTPQMKDILKLNYADGWFDIGGGLALHFTLSSGYNRYGCWGLTDDYTKPDRNYKMEAMRELAGQPESTDDELIRQTLPDYITIFPNPVNTTGFNLRINSSGNYNLLIYGLNGICIVNSNLTIPESGIISTGFTGLDLMPGLYSLRLTNGTENYYSKFIILN